MDDSVRDPQLRGPQDQIAVCGGPGARKGRAGLRSPTLAFISRVHINDRVKGTAFLRFWAFWQC